MVDINLIGDDNMKEERTEETPEEDNAEPDQVDELSQTASMDTHELAFEERTETFDTTKTAGFTRGRSYSSSMTILTIVTGIVVVAGLFWFFVLRDTPVDQPPQLAESATPSTPEMGEELPSESTSPPTSPEERPDLGSLEESGRESSGERPDAEPPAGRERTSGATDVLPSDISPSVSSAFLAESRLGIQSVTEVLSSVGTDLSTTLLSYTRQRLRYEFIGSARESREVVDQLNQRFGSTDFSVLSERDVTVDGEPMKKVLVSGTVSKFTAGNGGVSGGSESWDVARIEDWLKMTAGQFRLEIRQVKAQQGRLANGFTKRPLMMRVMGSKASLSNFLEVLSEKNLNLELAKILLVSPDMVSFSDENLILVLNMFVYES